MDFGWYIVLFASIFIFIVALQFFTIFLFRSSFFSFSKQLQKHLLHIVQPAFLKLTPETQSLIELSVDIWRLEKKITQSLCNIDEQQTQIVKNNIARLKNWLSKQDIEIMDYTGNLYNEGLNVEILSAGEISDHSERHIKDTIEPAILYRGKLIKKGKVTL